MATLNQQRPAGASAGAPGALPLAPPEQAEVRSTAARILAHGERCAVEVRDFGSSGDEDWEPRILLSESTGPDQVLGAIEETVRLSPDAAVRVAGYTRRRPRRSQRVAPYECHTPLAGLESAAVAATRAAALACQPWVGHGDGEAADAAATEAMRASLNGAPGRGRVVIGEGEKDEAPMLHNGERLGSGRGPAFDIAVDPLECTAFCAGGLPGALATIAMAKAGCLWSPGPAFYMDKLVAAPAARDAIDISEEPEENLRRVAEALGKRVRELTVIVLGKPRHAELVLRLREAGAAVHTPAEGDVAGALAALLPDGQADMLMGIGGTPEGVMTACAVAALGGGMQARLAPQRDDEVRALDAAGVDIGRALCLEDLVTGPSLFVATGVTGGELLRRPWVAGAQTRTESLVVCSGGMRRIVQRSPLASASSEHYRGWSWTANPKRRKR